MTEAKQLNAVAEVLYAALETNGAFLVTLDPDGRPNPMTIGWGLVGIAVRKPTFSIYLTKGGYTHETIRQAESFTISAPAVGTMTEALELCGKRSGREVDKVADACLTLTAGRAIPVPVVEGCTAAFECTRLLFSERENGDVVVFGQIAEAYSLSEGPTAPEN